MKIVSECLVGIECRYDGSAKTCQEVIDLVKQGKAMPVCPEQLGGLTTPRVPVEIVGDKIISKDGKDLTKEFNKGVKEALKIVKLINCKEAILKTRSPTCGCGEIYDGTFSGNLKKGDGIFTNALKKQGIKVITEKDLEC